MFTKVQLPKDNVSFKGNAGKRQITACVLHIDFKMHIEIQFIGLWTSLDYFYFALKISMRLQTFLFWW